MGRRASERDVILDAAANVVTNDGFAAATIRTVAARAGLDERLIVDSFPAPQELLVAMLNREFRTIRYLIADNVDRDPRGGLLSRIYHYSLTAIYESPLARSLYLNDRDALNTIMRASHGMPHVPQISTSPLFIRMMQHAGMVRLDVDPDSLAATITAVSAGAALIAPHDDLDQLSDGLTMMLERAVDADVIDTRPGKAAFFSYADSLSPC